MNGLFDAAGLFVEIGVAGAFAELFAEGFEVNGARIKHMIDAMAEAGHFYFVGEIGFHFGDGVVGRFRFEQHLDDCFIGAAVERAFEGTDSRGNGGVDVGKSGGGDAGGEGGGVQLVIGMEDEGDIEDALHDLVGLLAGERIDEVGGVTEGRIARHDRLAIAQLVEGGDESGDARHELDGFGDIGVGGRIGREWIIETQQRDGCAKDVHGAGAFWDAFEKRGYLSGQIAFGYQLVLQRREFSLVGEAAVPEEENDLFK